MEDLHAFTKLLLHDLRSPLGVIMLNTSWFANRAEPEKEPFLKISSDMLIEQARYMMDLIDKADRVYTLQLTTTEVHPACFNLVEFTREILKEFTAGIEQEIQFHPACDDLFITTDPIRYREALIYILENVVTFSQASEPITVHISYRNNGDLSLIITDPWAGFPPDKIDQIFTPFNRIQSSPSSPDKGNGLGLYLAKMIIEDLLKGTVTFETSSPKESRFEIHLPADYSNGCDTHQKQPLSSLTMSI